MPITQPTPDFAKASFLATVMAMAIGLLPPHASAAAEDRPPAGVEQIIPRGRIAAILEPRFVDAESADIPDDAWVLGVAMGGEARAYSLNLLNSHEVVNDRIAGTAFAAVW